MQKWKRCVTSAMRYWRRSMDETEQATLAQAALEYVKANYEYQWFIGLAPQDQLLRLDAERQVKFYNLLKVGEKILCQWRK
jgi:hypothetical protein